MICIKTEIPQEICDINYELKAIYNSKDKICLWVLKQELIEINLWTKLLECLKMIEKCILNLFIKFDENIKLAKHLRSTLEKHLRSFQKMHLNQ